MFKINNLVKNKINISPTLFLRNKYLVSSFFLLASWADPLAGQEKKETIIRISNQASKTIIEIDLPAPLSLLDPAKKTTLVFFALPNGNSIEWTKGKKIQNGDD